MVSIAPQPGTSFITDDPSWLGSAHGTDATETVTLDVAKFTAGTHYPNGYLPSGLNLGKVTATGLYGPYDNAASDGREVFVGHLAGPRKVDSASQKIAAAMLTHGKVREANLPVAIDANGKADAAGRIQYR